MIILVALFVLGGMVAGTAMLARPFVLGDMLDGLGLVCTGIAIAHEIWKAPKQ